MNRSLSACFLLIFIGALEVQAQVSIVYSGIKNIIIPTNFEGVYLDIDTGITGGPELAGLDINPFFGGVGIANSAAFQPVRSGTGNLDPYLNLAPGVVVNGMLNFSSGSGGTNTAHIGAAANKFHSGVDGYIGFKFIPNAGSTPLYGWMRVKLTENTSGALIRDWAYENTGAQIVVGTTVVPEPGVPGMLVLGSLLWLKRRRRQV